ncbi:MAG: tetratricopeptide repeat protein, partial [Paludibacteraceae bacterium]|nr:tetratricopeptide repeat protein [Paludibacteraceae bacterium]
YGWLKEAIEKGGEKNEAQVFQQYFILSDGIYKANPTINRDLYIADYMKIMPMMTAAAANDSTFDASISVVNKVFARSGAAECGTLDKAYASKIEENKSDKAFLNDVLKLYRIAGCKESAVYFKGSAYLHAIEPTASSASGMAAQAFSKKDYSKAISYYQEAIKLETSKDAKSDYYYNIAYIYSLQKNYPAARSNAQSALAMDPTAGKVYMLIATLYAGGYTQIDDDPVIQKTAFWAAVDKLEKAKAVDPSLASQANSLIASYKKQFPDKSELFMRGIKGGSYKVPGWIGETTTVR